MQEPISRSCATAGIALASAGLMTVAPLLVAPTAPAGPPAVALAASYGDLFTNTWDNLSRISETADWTSMWQVFTALFTNPAGLIDAFSTFSVDVETDFASLPATVAVDLSPAITFPIAGIVSHLASLDAFIGVINDLGDPQTAFAALWNAPATILDAHLNGLHNLSLLDGIVNIPVYRGILAPEQNLEIDLDLAKVLGLFGVDEPTLEQLDLDDVIAAVRAGTLTVDGLLTGLGVSDDGLGDLLKLATDVGNLGELLDWLGVGDLGLGIYNLATVLGDLGLDPEFYRNLDFDAQLADLPFMDLLSAFGFPSGIALGLGQLFVDLGDSDLIGDLLNSPLTEIELVTEALRWLSTAAAGYLNPIPLVGPLLTSFAQALLGPDGLEGLLSGVTFADLVGDLSLDETLSSLLGTVGGAVLTVGSWTMGGILGDLGLGDVLGTVTLGEIFGDWSGVLTDGVLGINITGLLNYVNVSDVVSLIGLDGISLDFGDLNPYLADLLEGLGQGQVDLASVSVGSFSGIATELFVTMPQQILALLEA